MIIDQLFTPKPLKEGGPYDLPGKDYDRPGDTPRKQSSGENNPYPYSPEEDDDHFREIFRKKREAAKKAEQSKLAESMLMEDPIYRDFKRVGQYISEQKLTEPEILQIFSNAETGMTDKGTGANRTFLGRGKDTTMDFAGGVADALKGVWSGIQNSVPVQAVDTAWDQATDAVANLTGGQKGAVMTAINKYRNLAKQYPKTAGLSKAALVAIAGLATGGAGLPAVAALVYGLDSAIKGEKFSDIALKAGGAGATAWAGGKLFGSDPNAFDPGSGTGWDASQTPGGPTDVSGLVDPDPGMGAGFAGGQYTVQDGDQIGYIAQAMGVKPQDITGLNPQIDFTKPLKIGTVLDLPQQGDNAGNLWTDYVQGSNYGDKVPGATPDVSQAAAGGNQFDLPNADAAQNAAADTQAAADYAAAGPAEKAEILKTTGMTADQLTQLNSPKIDYSQAGPMSTDSLGQKLEYGIPVNNDGSFIPPSSSLPADELAKQTAAYNSWKSDFMKRFPEATPGPDGSMLKFKPGLAPMYPGMTPKTFESVKFKIIPASKLIDQKATVLNWALNESVGRRSRSVNLTTIGTYTVFENVDRYRRALLEYAGGTQPGRPELPDQYAPAMPGGAGVPTKPGLIGRGLNYLDRGVKKVGGALSNFGHQFTTNVTKEKLKMNWHQAGKPSDSDQLAAWLVKQGVPQQVVTSVYGKMSIPYTAPTTVQPAGQADAQTAADPAQASAPKTGTAQRLMPFNNINPKTGQRWTVDDLEAERNPQTTSATNTAAPGAEPAPTATKTTTGGPPGFDASNIFKQPGMEKYAKKPATPPAKTPNFAGPGGYGKVTQTFKPTAPTAPASTATASKGGLDKKTQDYINAINAKQPASLAENRIAIALKKPVAEMLQMVETKEDVQKIKQFVDQTFVKYGAVTESAFAVRNQILEHVTQVGAQRRREHSQLVAH